MARKDEAARHLRRSSRAYWPFADPALQSMRIVAPAASRCWRAQSISARLELRLTVSKAISRSMHVHGPWIGRGRTRHSLAPAVAATLWQTRQIEPTNPKVKPSEPIMPDVVVIGGGITGAAAALSLAEEGQAVTLIEKHGIAAMASGWTLGGVRQSGRDPAELPLARAAVAIWATLGERLGQRRALPTSRQSAPGAHRGRGRDHPRARRAATRRGARARVPRDERRRARASRRRSPSMCSRPRSARATATPIRSRRRKPLPRPRGARAASFAKASRSRPSASSDGRVAGVETSEGFVPAACVIVAAGVNTPALLAGARARPAAQGDARACAADASLAAHARSGVRRRQCGLRRPAGSRWAASCHLGVAALHGRCRPMERCRRSRRAQRKSSASRELVGQVLPIVKDAPQHRAWGGLIDLTPDALPVLDAPDEIPGLVDRRRLLRTWLLPRPGERRGSCRSRARPRAAP